MATPVDDAVAKLFLCDDEVGTGSPKGNPCASNSKRVSRKVRPVATTMSMPASAAANSAALQASLIFASPSLQSSKVLSKSIATKSNRRMPTTPFTPN